MLEDELIQKVWFLSLFNMVNLQNKKKVSQPGVNKHYFYPNFVYKGLTPPPHYGLPSYANRKR